MGMRQEILIATRNPGKIKEFQAFFAEWGWQVKGLDQFPDLPEIIEDGLTFEDNARKKAESLFRWTGMPALADDSGLEVDALGGRPGVYSARFAGEHASDAENNLKLLHALDGVPLERRTARFRCVLFLMFSEERTMTAEGICEGVILTAPRGNGGFGYDPLFYLPAYGKTMAELDPNEKNQVSHRGQALRQLAARLAEEIRNRNKPVP